MKPQLSQRSRATIRAREQRGAATLVVVMILFFIMAMMAAYANRSLIFEQRIASNYYRSGVAVEAAEAGLDWTLAMLNGGNVDGLCATGGSSTFRQRYLVSDPSTLNFTSTLPSSNSDTSPVASCVRQPTSWICSCPATGTIATTPAPAVSADMQPSFQVGLSGTGKVVTIQSLGCTGSTASACKTDAVTVAAAAQQLLAGSHASVQAALVSALKSPPAAPLTVRLSVFDGSAQLGLHNSDATGNGLLLVAGGTDTLSDTRLESLPGTPVRTAVFTNDATLSGIASADAVFARFFGMAPEQYKNQPAIRDAACANCADADINQAIDAGAQMIWVDGALTLSSNGTFGTAARPVVIVVNGPVTIIGSVTINGVLYAVGNVTASATQIVVNGAVMGGGNFNITSGLMDIYYQASIINLASNTLGSFVRVPGSWWEGQ